MLQGTRLERIDRRGKFLAIIAADGGALGVHLGMTGQLLWAARGRRLPRDHVHATWRLDDGSRLIFRDPRRFGGLWLAPSRDELPPWRGLGPDALTLEPQAYYGLLAGVRRPIKAALLDQHLLAGVGNIYADEALHEARIYPRTTASELSGSQATALGRAVARLLATAVEAGGSTLRDYRGAEGDPGSFQSQHRVYGRGGQPCRACQTTLAVELLAQRTTVWCPACQFSNDLSTTNPQGRGASLSSPPRYSSTL